MDIVGEVFTSNFNGDFKVLGRSSRKHRKAYYDIVFLATGYKNAYTRDKIITGEIKDPYYPRVFGTGFVGEGAYKTRIKGERVLAHHVWENMLARCYYPKTARYESYGGKGVVVYSGWHNYQIFAEWFNDNYVDGMYLDKDILGWNIREYSPITCCFVPRYINNLLVHKNRGRYLFGVEKSGKKWRAKALTTDIGYFNTEVEAHTAYKQYKLNHIREQAELAYSTNDINKNIRNALLKFDINEEGFVYND